MNGLGDTAFPYPYPDTRYMPKAKLLQKKKYVWYKICIKVNRNKSAHKIMKTCRIRTKYHIFLINSIMQLGRCGPGSSAWA